MLGKQAISQVETHLEMVGFLYSVFLGHRPIMKLNELIPHIHFKMKIIHMLKDLLQQEDFVAKIYLKDVMPTSEEDRKYLWFR